MQELSGNLHRSKCLMTPTQPPHTENEEGWKGQVDNERKAGLKEIELKRAKDKEEMRVDCNGCHGHM